MVRSTAVPVTLSTVTCQYMMTCHDRLAHMQHCTHCPPPPSGGHTLLDSKPTLRDLDKFVIGQLAWTIVDSFPLHLGVELSVIKIASRNNPNDCEGALREVLNSWLDGARNTGKEDRTWHSVLTALETSNGAEVARQLRTELLRPSVDPHVTDWHAYVTCTCDT